MKAKILEGDLKKFTEDELKDLIRDVYKYTTVVVKNQNLTPEEQLKICQVIGDVQQTWIPGRTEGISVINGVVRVTGKKDEKGLRGIFGHNHVLEWHVNKASNIERKPIIAIYGVEGTKGSRTSFMNTIDAWEDLPEDVKDELRDVKVICGYKPNTYTDSPFHKEHMNYKNEIPLVRTNEEGKTGLFIPFYQTFHFVDHTPEEFDYWKTFLRAHCVQDKYIYHHDWDDGDIIFNEQWLSQHKRWPFEEMNKRVLHRVAFDPRNVYKNTDYGRRLYGIVPN